MYTTALGIQFLKMCVKILLHLLLCLCTGIPCTGQAKHLCLFTTHQHLIAFWRPLGCGSLTRQPEKHECRNGFEQDCKLSAPLGKSELLTQTLRELGQCENMLNCENKGCVKLATTNSWKNTYTIFLTMIDFFFFPVGVTCKVYVTSRDKERKKRSTGNLREGTKMVCLKFKLKC